jgi:hypothetical protein
MWPREVYDNIANTGLLSRSGSINNQGLELPTHLLLGWFAFAFNMKQIIEILDLKNV